MKTQGINKFHRFIFINSYALLLVILGICIGVIPIYRINLWLLLPQIILVGIFLTSSIRIFTSWEHKKRDYSILIRKNEEEIRLSSFSEYMQAPCGRLLTILVLYDLGKLSVYKDLKKLQKPLIQRLKEGCTRKQTVVTVYKKD